MKNYRQSAAWPTAQEPPPGMEMTTSVPVRPAGFVSDVLVPLAQAAVTGALLAALLTVAACTLFNIDIKPIIIWAGLALLITTGAWLLLLVDHRRLLWAIETMTGIDLDQDGAVGNAEKRRLEVELKLSERSTVIVDSEWLEIDDAQLSAFALGLMGGRKLTEAAWGKDRAAFPEGINQFRAFRERIEGAGLIRRINPDVASSPYEVTPAGRAVFGRIAEDARTGQ